jgi:hypothetical protein
MQLIWWLLRLMGHINLLMDENKCKIDATNEIFNTCIIVMKVTKIVESWSCSCKYFQI